MNEQQAELTSEQLKQIQSECRPPWLNEQLESSETVDPIELPIDLGADQEEE